MVEYRLMTRLIFRVAGSRHRWRRSRHLLASKNRHRLPPKFLPCFV